MLVYQNKLILIHMQSCGGTSVGRALLNALGHSNTEYYGYDQTGEERNTQQLAAKKILWKHSTALECQQALSSNVWKQALKVFVSLRNPWERVASWYQYCLKRAQVAPDHAYLQRVASLSFHQFVMEKHFMRRDVLDFICDPKGNVLVDIIMNITDLQKGMNEVTERLGIPQITIDQHNVNKHSSLTPVYTPEEHEFIQTFFKHEIRQFWTDNHAAEQ
jgi:hypothetical protein